MGRRIEKRLQDLEKMSEAREGVMILHEHDDGFYTEHSPYSPDPGQRFTAAEKHALARTVGFMIIVKRTKRGGATDDNEGTEKTT